MNNGMLNLQKHLLTSASCFSIFKNKIKKFPLEGNEYETNTKQINQPGKHLQRRSQTSFGEHFQRRLQPKPDSFFFNRLYDAQHNH